MDTATFAWAEHKCPRCGKPNHFFLGAVCVVCRFEDVANDERVRAAEIVRSHATVDFEAERIAQEILGS